MSGKFAIFVSTKSWSLARITSGECRIISLDNVQGLNPPILPVAEALRALGYMGEGVFLGLPSTECLSAAIDRHDLRYRERSSVLRFKLEEHFPISTEDFVADFIPGKAKLLGVAVQIKNVQPLIDAFERADIAILSVCPTALLVADQIHHERSISNQNRAILCQLDDTLDLVQLEAGVANTWTTTPKSWAAIEPHLRRAVYSCANSLSLVACGLDMTFENSFETIEELVCEDATHSPLQLASVAAGRILDGANPPVDLRRHELAVRNPLRQVRTPLRFALAAMLLLSFIFSSVMFLRVAQFDRLSQEQQEDQIKAFQQALPRQSVPPLILSRMLSEERRLRGLSGIESKLPPEMSVLPLLHNTLEGLPEQVRFRLIELRFEPTSFYIEGQTIDHSDADKIAIALRRSTGLQIDAPRTEQAAGDDVTFTMSATAETAKPMLASQKIETDE